MAGLLRLAGAGICCLLSLGPTHAEISDRHELHLGIESVFADSNSDLGAWTDGGFGKLRTASDGSVEATTRLAIEYRGEILPTVSALLVLDASEDAESRLGLTEAYFEWRPLPLGPTRHRFRFGAFYPAWSMENVGAAWESPYSISFSAINSWLGEEIRPIGAEWRMNRPIGQRGSPQEFGFSAGLFLGNDAAATLLFWRGWAVHNKQIRLNDHLGLPPLVLDNTPDAPIIVGRRLDPISEIDDRPGFYAGAEWRYGNRAKLALSIYDNRGDPYAFRDGQWAWGTRFWHLAGQVSLPGDVALLGQAMRGDTDWLVPPSTDGSVTPTMALITDEYESRYLMLSKMFLDRHRISLRHDAFDFWRPGEFTVDRGNATTLAYNYEISSRLTLMVEWMEIESTRDLWPIFYATPERHRKETIAQTGFRVELFDSKI